MMSRQLAPAKSSASNQASTSASGPGVQDAQEENGVPITEEEVVGYREQDRFLPINNIQRLMKRSLPESSKISKDAKECIQEATSEFISFITSEAADRATSEKRKTITGDDILNALKTLGFDEMSEVLLIYLAKYRELQSKEPARKRSRKSSGGGDASKLLNGNTPNIGASASTSAALTLPPPSESLGSNLTMPPSSYAHMLAEAKAGHGGAMNGYDEDDLNGNDDDDGDDALDMLEFPSDNE